MDAGTQITVQRICYLVSPFQQKPKSPCNLYYIFEYRISWSFKQWFWILCIRKPKKDRWKSMVELWAVRTLN